jgi:hypothetical protein
MLRFKNGAELPGSIARATGEEFKGPHRAVIDTITAVLVHAEKPLRARDIHAAAEELLGWPIKRSSVKATLAAHASGPLPRFERVGYGRYRMA